MIAIVGMSRDLRESVRYNERKVESLQAKFLDAGFFNIDAFKISNKQKLQRFFDRFELNENVKVGVINFSLNFDKTDNLLPKDLIRVSCEFLSKIGLGNQPFLLYEHHDAGHKHVHLVSTVLKSDGKRITPPSIAAIKKACRELEIKHSLKRYQALESKLDVGQLPETLNGKRQTGPVIQWALKSVLEKFHFTSLCEFNAVLHQYGVKALTGKINSRVFKNGGLLYALIDNFGKSRSLPIKASRFGSDVTLKGLGKIFSLNKTQQSAGILRLKNAVDLGLTNQESVSELSESLRLAGIRIHVRAERGALALTYIDNRTGCVVDESGLEDRYKLSSLYRNYANASDRSKLYQYVNNTGDNDGRFQPNHQPAINLYRVCQEKRIGDMLLDELLAAVADHSLAPWELRADKKKKKRKQLRL